LDLLTLEDGTDRLSRNVGKELLLYGAKYPSGAQIAFGNVLGEVKYGAWLVAEGNRKVNKKFDT
jgi:hypothetical protein